MKQLGHLSSSKYKFSLLRLVSLSEKVFLSFFLSFSDINEGVRQIWNSKGGVKEDKQALFSFLCFESSSSKPDTKRCLQLLWAPLSFASLPHTHIHAQTHTHTHTLAHTDTHAHTHRYTLTSFFLLFHYFSQEFCPSCLSLPKLLCCHSKLSISSSFNIFLS